jgi:hypothetical protein
MSESDFDWGALESDVVDGVFCPSTKKTNPKSPDAKTETFNCDACFGTGRWQRGRVNYNGDSKCFACGGKGYFMTSKRDRALATQKRHESKAKKLANDRAAYDAANPGIGDFLVEAATWSSFAADILGKLNQYGFLFEKQTAAIQRMRDKQQTRNAPSLDPAAAASTLDTFESQYPGLLGCMDSAAAWSGFAKDIAAKIRNGESLSERQLSAAQSMQSKAAARETTATQIDLSPIRAMFDAAVSNGKKAPIYRAAGLVISLAKATGKNPGALYVKTTNDEYLGKLLGTTYLGKPAPALADIAKDPRAAAIAYGRETSRCSCCGLELTNPESIKLGIGPICAAKFNL